MKMFEKLKVGAAYRKVTDDELAYAQKVYDRYVGFLKDRYGPSYGTVKDQTAVSLAEFLLQDVDYCRLDSFTMGAGVLVKTEDGAIGITVGWTVVGFNSPRYAVLVKTAAGTGFHDVDDLEEASIPPEVLEYVKSTLQDEVHDKVDEAFA